MNARQTKKLLKKKIDKIQSDNKLMHDIIADTPAMQNLYDCYNKSLNIIYTPLQFKQIRARRFLPYDKRNNCEVITKVKQELERDLFEIVKNLITYDYNTECLPPSITASIFASRKGR